MCTQESTQEPHHISRTSQNMEKQLEDQKTDSGLIYSEFTHRLTANINYITDRVEITKLFSFTLSTFTNKLCYVANHSWRQFSEFVWLSKLEGQIEDCNYKTQPRFGRVKRPNVTRWRLLLPPSAKLSPIAIYAMFTYEGLCRECQILTRSTTYL